MKICKVLFFLVFTCCFALAAFADEINISLDKDVITEADTVNLTISYSGDSDEKPDLSALQNDFQIVSNMATQRVNYVNGNFSQVKSWTIGLKPLKLGKITIKPIQIGSVRSNYADVEVKEVTNVAYVPDSRENSNSPYFKIEQTISPTSPYVQQQALVWVTLYDSLGLQNGSLSISDETLKNWSITPVSSKPIVKSDFINGKKMNVVKYAFAAFPLKSGEINSPQFIFDGDYIKNVGFNLPNFNDAFMNFGIDFQNSFGQRVPVRMKTTSEKIHVLPAPQNFTGVWLPLTNLTIDAQWAPNTKFQTGEALTRNITVQATGLQEEMFPTLSFPDIDGFKQYPEKPEISSSVKDGKIITTAKYNIVYIPSKSGSFTFPKQEIQWFNVLTKNFQKSVIPSETVKIAYNPNVPDAQEPEQFTQPTSNSSIVQDNQEAQKIVLPHNSALSSISKIKAYGRYILLIAVLLILLFLFKFFKSRPGKDTYKATVISSIRKKNYAEARRNLILWANTKFQHSSIQNLNDVAKAVDDSEFSAQINLLNEVLYSDALKDFNAAEFISIFKKIDKQVRKSTKNKEILPNLYN